jgi:hypothetical protein
MPECFYGVQYLTGRQIFVGLTRQQAFWRPPAGIVLDLLFAMPTDEYTEAEAWCALAARTGIESATGLIEDWDNP